ncbi:mitochondrial dimethyladenosine transferase 1 [Daphnia magna]|uniref:rRNA adenine N(6)-methyltransferase n=1 Tax=Daphnia magna TaxID=35525 RepID=A0A0P5PUP4_9CRUS|nr:mitochondrial dimethyladenosine transferase 1 [Daphnia magna]XP_032782133.1 mitochondrial dimethyladenosine transferase 1 [Daphnia magna]
MSIPLISRLPPLPAVRDLLNLYRLQAVKQLSQNFLLDPKLTNKLVSAAGKITDGYVCEVGPGAGSLTRIILSRNVRQLIVVEKDKRFQPPLEMLAEASDNRMSVIWGDVLSHNLRNSFPQESSCDWNDVTPNIHIIGNLPFNIATPLIIKWLCAISERSDAWAHGRVRLTLTFQKEVAERMVAPIGTSERCRLSVMVQHLCHVQHKFTIPGRAFVPKPNVDVGVVHFTPLIVPKIKAPFSLVEKVARNTFSFRQKYCRRGLEMLFPTSMRAEQVQTLLRLADVDGTLRPFELSIEEFDRLCQAYSVILEKFPSLARYNSRSTDGIDDILFAEQL